MPAWKKHVFGTSFGANKRSTRWTQKWACLKVSNKGGPVLKAFLWTSKWHPKVSILLLRIGTKSEDTHSLLVWGCCCQKSCCFWYPFSVPAMGPKTNSQLKTSTNMKQSMLLHTHANGVNKCTLLLVRVFGCGFSVGLGMGLWMVWGWAWVLV